MDIFAPGCSSILTVPPSPLSAPGTAAPAGKVDLSANRHAAAAADRLRQDGVCIEARGCDRAADENVDIAARAKTAVLTADVQRKSVNVGKPPLRIDDDLGGVERFVGGHCADQAAAAADALREDGDAVLAGRGDGAAARTIPGGDGDNTAVTSATTIAANAHAEALQRTVDRAGERSLAAAAADALREDAECRDALRQDRAARAVDDGDGAACASGAALTAHRERGLDRHVVGGLVGRTRGAAAAAAAADALGIDAVGLGPVRRDRSGVGCVRRTAITGSAASAPDRNRNVDIHGCCRYSLDWPAWGCEKMPFSSSYVACISWPICPIWRMPSPRFVTV